MISCIVIDDELFAQQGMLLLIRQVEFLELKGVFKNVIEADLFLRDQPVDLIFLDIHMPGLNGMEYLKLTQNKSLAILTTAFSDQAVDAFEYGAVDYLLKPIRFERFYKAVQKAVNFLENKTKSQVAVSPSSPEKHFFIKHGRKLLRFNYTDVLFIEGLKDYSLIHTHGRRVDVPVNLKTMEKNFHSDVFIRVSKSHIINKSYVTHIEGEVIQLMEHSITLSPLYKDAFYKNVVNGHYFKKR